jgi:hypothetical protein
VYIPIASQHAFALNLASISFVYLFLCALATCSAATPEESNPRHSKSPQQAENISIPTISQQPTNRGGADLVRETSASAIAAEQAVAHTWEGVHDQWILRVPRRASVAQVWHGAIATHNFAALVT